MMELSRSAVLSLLIASALQAAPYALTGQVVDEQGRPVPGLIVSATKIGPRAGGLMGQAPEGLTGPDGRYTIPIAQPDERTFYSVRAHLEGWLTVQEGIVLRDDVMTGKVQPVIVWRTDQAISGQVLDPTGEPVAGATVFGTTVPTRPVTTGEDGSFVLVGQRPAANRIAAVLGPSDRAEATVDGGATGVKLVLQPVPQRTPEQDRALAGQLLAEAYTIAKSVPPSTPWIAVGVGLNAYDDTAAWPQVAALGTHWMRDKARQEMLGNAAMADPAWAVKLLPHLAEFGDSDQQQMTTVLLAFLLQPTHPDVATELVAQSLAGPPLAKSPTNTAIYEILLAAALQRLGRDAEAIGRLDAIRDALAGTTGFRQVQAFQIFGWFWAEWPDLLALALADAPTEDLARMAELISLRHEARRDPAAAASLLPSLAPTLADQAQTVPDNSTAAWLEGEFYRAVPAVAVELLLTDPEAGQAFIAPLPGRVRAEILGWAASRADDSAGQTLAEQGGQVLFSPETRAASGQTPVAFGARYRMTGQSIAATAARLQRLQRRRGWPITPAPELDWRAIIADYATPFYRGEVDPNHSWLFAEPMLLRGDRDFRQRTSAWSRVCLALCPANVERAAALAREGVPGADPLPPDEQVYGRCLVARWLLASTAERAQMPFSDDPFEYAMVPWMHEPAW